LTGKRKRGKSSTREPDDAGRHTPARLRIIGGSLGGRKLLYSGDERTRPMKDRVREAVFNLLGDDVVGKHAVDLFAGTGALALEALSRGAAHATLIEKHFPTADVIRQNAEQLGVAERCQIEPADTFIWVRRGPQLGPAAWLVFCSPPFAFYSERRAEMIELVGSLMRQSPAESLFVVEADLGFDFAELPHAAAWEIREYPPAVIGIYRRGA